MRKIASITQPSGDMKRAMIFAHTDGVYLFLYDFTGDGPCEEEHVFTTVDAAEKAAADRYGISAVAWQVIPDPPPGCQHDWIAPTRVKQDAAGNKLWGQFEPAR